MSNALFQTKSHWMTTRAYTPGPRLKGDIEVDAAIVGFMHVEDRMYDAKP